MDGFCDRILPFILEATQAKVLKDY